MKKEDDNGEARFTIRGTRSAPDEPFDVWGELRVPMTSGALAGFTAKIELKLIDGAVHHIRTTLEPNEPAPLLTATSKAHRAMQIGDVQELAEACLRNMAPEFVGALPWLDAFAATRRRPGRAGVPDQLWARVALRRVEAEEKAPGNAIRYMRRTWPDEFGVTDNAVSSKVNKAKNKGMIEFVDSMPRLTPKALAIIEGIDES